jgi:flavin reductase (DIM6/NTAB) family NADH-FMN oxidoreductase RutF
MQSRAAHTLDFRKALSQFATGVTVVTTRSAAGDPVGLTANSFSSVSLEPPLVLWSLALASSAVPVFQSCERYLIHVLGANQLEVARRFAARGADRFAEQRAPQATWQYNGSGLPQLAGCVAWFECGNRSRYEEGDHMILVGRVEAFHIAGGTPLIFHDGRYITELAEAPLPRGLRRPLA